MRLSTLVKKWSEWGAYFALLAATALPAIFAFIFIPAVTANSSLEQFGKYSAFQSMVLGINLVAGFSSAGYVSNAYIRKKDNAAVYSNMIGLLLASIPLVIFASVLIDFLVLNQGLYAVVLLTGCALATYINSLFGAYLILSKKYVVVFFFTLIQLLSQYLLVLILIDIDEVSSTYLAGAQFFGLFLSAACYLYFRPGLDGFRYSIINFIEMRRVLLYGVPLAFHFLMSLTIGTFDRWYLSYASQNELLAQYSVASTVSGIAFMVLDFWNKIYSPKIFDLLANGRDVQRAHFRLHAHFATGSLLSMFFLGLIGAGYIQHFIGGKYSDVIDYYFMMTAVNFGFVIYYLAAPYIYYFNKTKYVLYSSAFGVLVVTTLMVLNKEAVSAASLIMIKGVGFVVMGAVAIYLARKCYVVSRTR